MAMFAEVLHFGPWDIERMTVTQFEYYVRYLEDREKKMRDG